MGDEASALPLFCGVDLGAAATKLVLLDQERTVLARVVRSSGVDYCATAQACLDKALSDAGLQAQQLTRTVATGYGRQSVSYADHRATEIHCHGIGAFSELQRAMTLVDIGGQDTKVISLDGAGRRIEFTMNRKCAAGTGAFLEQIAHRLNVEPSMLENLARSCESAVTLSSFCTVFAATEVLTHLRAGAPAAQIIRGAFASVVERVLEMAPLGNGVVLSGGVVAHNPTIAELLSARIGAPVEIAPYPQLTGALGAALTARGG